MEKTVKHNAKNAAKVANTENATLIPAVITNSLPSVQNARAQKPQLYTGEAAFSLREFESLDKLVGKLDFEATDNVAMEQNDNAVVAIGRRISSMLARTEAFSEAKCKFCGIFSAVELTWDAYREALNANNADDIFSASQAWERAFTTLSVMINAFKTSWENLKKYYTLASEYKVKRNEYIRLLTAGQDIDAINDAGKKQASVRADIGRAKSAFLKTWHDFLSMDIREIA